MSPTFFHRGGLWVLGQGILLLAVIVSGLVWHAEWGIRPLRLCGAALLLASAGCALAGVRVLGRGLTPFPRPLAGARLVQTGIYAFMRHPLYTAVFSGAVGYALFRESWPALVAGLALGPFFDAKARREESWLRRQFPEYAAYEQRVKRFLPWVY